MKNTNLCLIMLSLLSSLDAIASFERVEGLDAARITRVAFGKLDPSFLAVSSDNTLYTSKDVGLTFRKATVLKAERITHLFIEENANTAIYLSGSRHCYRICDRTDRIFSADAEETVNYIAKHNGVVYVATSGGLYCSDESFISWKTVPGLKNSAVYSVEGIGDKVYLTCDKGIYLLYPSGSLQRLFVTRSNGEGGGLLPTQLRHDIYRPGCLWLCTNKGVFRSLNHGESWNRFYISGANNVEAHCLAQTQSETNTFYLCSSAGFFRVDIETGDSTALFEGLPSRQIRWMDFSSAGDIHLATDAGLFKCSSVAEPPSSRISLEEMMKREPSIQQTHAAALHYNSVHPDKVGKWRRNLKYRALFPKLSLDYDNTIRGATKDGKYYFSEGPYEWGVSLSWDIGNLIWNSYEDDIDNRNKLTTQLRMDILDEVNRLYFERLRLKREIMEAGSTQDTSLQVLRLHELTAALDGYTGGQFTRM